MNYAEQKQLFSRYRTIAGGGAVLVAASNILLIWLDDELTLAARSVLAAVVVVVAYLIYYLPTYLGLTVEPNKPVRWAIRFRWFIVGSVLLIGASFTLRNGAQSIIWLGATIAALAAVNAFVRLARKTRGDMWIVRRAAWIYLATDALLIFLWASRLRAGAVTFVTVLLQVALVLYIATAEHSRARWSRGRRRIIVLLGAASIAGTLASVLEDERAVLVALTAVLLCATIAEILVAFVAKWNAASIAKATTEISRFTGITTESAHARLNKASSMLAANWLREQPATPAEVAAWYQRNSELYIYDLTGFHLYGKHIRFTLDLVSLAEGRVLDYGAGIGDLALELARRGHPTVYFDVDGQTRRFAEWRAQQQEIDRIDFYTEREQVSGLFNIIYSLDVLEHLPDPEDALRFLTEKLAPGGRLVVTAPFGETDAHPMHFSHLMDAHEFLRSEGLVEAKRGLRWTGSAMMRKKHVLIYQKPRTGNGKGDNYNGS